MVPWSPTAHPSVGETIAMLSKAWSVWLDTCIQAPPRSWTISPSEPTAQPSLAETIAIPYRLESELLGGPVKLVSCCHFPWEYCSTSALVGWAGWGPVPPERLPTAQPSPGGTIAMA